MTTVTFYYRKTSQHLGKARLVCQLASTAYRNGHKVYVSVQNEDQCEMLNQMLWTFSPNSYVPHTSLTDDRDPDLEKFPVVIGVSDPPDKFNDVLISLHDEVPSFVNRFQRVVEPVDAHPEDEAKAKARFTQYQSLFESEPKTHYI